jgi:hypothetical protein
VSASRRPLARELGIDLVAGSIAERREGRERGVALGHADEMRRVLGGDGDRGDSELAGRPEDPREVRVLALVVVERAVAEVLLDRAARQQVLRPGLVVLADKGLAGREFEWVVGDLGAVLARPDRRDEPYRFGSLGGVRQWVEAILDTLKDQLGLERHGAHTIQGVWVRVAQRLLALATGVWFNWQINAPIKRSLVAYDH